MKKLAIISSYNENCGNASYTHVLKKAFSKYVDVDVIGLDLFLLQSISPAVRKAGDLHVRQICERLRGYDYVNIQFEAGLFGKTTQDVLRRIKWIIDASQAITITMHRVESEKESYYAAVKIGFARRSFKRFRQKRRATRYTTMTGRLVEYCKKTADKKTVLIKVHTRRDRRAIEVVFRNPHTYDYPICFLTDEERDQAWQLDGREAFLERHGFEEGSKVIGLFGYLSAYKGVDTAIKALARLPKEYKLGLFGSQHPQSVKRNEIVDPYIEDLIELMDEIDGRNVMSEMAEDFAKSKDGSKDFATEFFKHVILQKVKAPDFAAVSERVRFVGGLPDPEFIKALRLCDVAVLPYLETGQGMSGVIVLSLEAGAKMLCANNISFMETARYFPNSFSSFDIGNYVELAQKIEWVVSNREVADFKENRDKARERYNIDASVRLQLEKFGCQIQ
ncbi:MAG: hypothetical protein J7485_05420 [Sphingobium sp.]|nr:hypothetical protein [Sphingobium sp.]